MTKFASIFVALAATLVAPPVCAGDAKAGERVFAKVCSACHTIALGARHRVGPNLHGVFARKAAQAPNYPYTAAFKAAEVVWDEDALDAFLEAPGRFIRGTKMDWTLPDEKDRADVIALLKSAQ